MSDKIGTAAYTSSILTFLAGLSLSDFAMLTGIFTSIFLAVWKVYVDRVHMKNEQILIQQNKTLQ